VGRRGRWIFPALAVGVTANAFRLRQRIQSLPVLEATEESVDPDHLFVTAAGVDLDPTTARAASRYARANGLEALDIVPADLQVEKILDLARLVNRRTYRTDPLAPGRGAGHAILVSRDLAERAQVTKFRGLDPVEILTLTARVKRHAPLASDLAVAPKLRALDDDVRTKFACLQAMYSFGTPIVVGTIGTELALLLAGFASRRRWGIAAAAAYTVQPWLALGGTHVRPRDLNSRTPVRLAASSIDLVRAVSSRWRSPSNARRGGTREEYEKLLAGGIERFFEDRRPDCPLCGSRELSVRVRTGDLLQRKPGEFVLEECGSCGHIFQNPRLTIEGLDFYYRDFYDGVGAEELELIFSTGVAAYRGRAETVRGFAEPGRWLDVGTGQGHFCLIARETWPDTTFDGLDMGPGVEEGARRGWLDRGYRGLFPEMASELRGRYDVVSMHHYLEHTREPAVEIDAAAEVLVPGGHLLIEVPDPESRLGRTLGKWWGPWFQPQHQHFVSAENLQKLLAERGFTTVVEQRAKPHQPCDLVFGGYLAVNRIAPPTDAPWLPQASRWHRLRRPAVFTAAAPVLALLLLADNLLAPIVSRNRGSNTYRVLARYDDQTIVLRDAEMTETEDGSLLEQSI
jgi:SAM-dependent methyltransferase